MDKVTLPRNGGIGIKTMTLPVDMVLQDAESHVRFRAGLLSHRLRSLRDCIVPRRKSAYSGLEERKRLARLLIDDCREEIDQMRRDYLKIENIANAFLLLTE